MPRHHTKTRNQPSHAPDSRSQAVLAAIIKEHLNTGEAVGSKVLSERFAHRHGWSAATIRNVMSDLEDAGLVEQPHTSAGRIPTDKGYRYYVDNMIGENKLSRADLSVIDRIFPPSDAHSLSPERMMERASRVLSELSSNVGIVISPSLSSNQLKHIEFLLLSANRILVVLVTGTNNVHNKLIRIDETLTQEDLERTARYLNTEFAGKTLVAIRAEILELMREEKALYDRLLRNAVLLCDVSLRDDDDGAGEVYVEGASNMLAKPDFADIDRMRELFRTFEEKSRLIRILNECVSSDQYAASDDVHVIIGREHPTSSMRNCTLITAPYRLGSSETAGTIGVVGPTRIEYSRVMAMVNYMARLIERRLSEGVPPG